MTTDRYKGIIVKRLKSLQSILILCHLVFAISACSEEPTLRIGSNKWPGYEPFYLARDLHAFDRSDINLVELPSASDVMQYLRNGALDGGMLTLDEVITLIEENVPLRVILVMDVSNGADALLAQPDIKKLDNIKGKRVGVELSALGALMLESVLEASKLEVEQIKIVPLTFDHHENAFRTKAVDAVITFEPTRSRLLADNAVELFNSSQIPGRIIDVLVVREEILQTQTGHLRKLLAGYFEARRLMDSQPKIAVSKMAPRVNMEAEALQMAYAGMHLPDIQENQQWLGTQSPKLIDSANKLASLMKRKKLISRLPDLSRLAEKRFLPVE